MFQEKGGGMWANRNVTYHQLQIMIPKIVWPFYIHPATLIEIIDDYVFNR